MSLQLILGGAGSGKSHYLYQQMIRHSLDHPHQKHFILVPEQFTMETQKNIIALHPSHSTDTLDVVSFQRLAYRVFEEMGFRGYTLLDDMGKSMILRKVAQEHEKEFSLFGRNLKRAGFISQLKSMLSEFYQYGISLDQILDVSGQLDGRPLLKYKLHDLAVAYAGFAEKLGEDAITAEEVLIRLCEMAGSSPMLRDSIVAIDGFTGFTPIQYRLLSILMPVVQNITVTVTIGLEEYRSRPEGGHELFYLSRKTADRLKELAQQTDTPVLEDCLLAPPVPPRFREAPPLFFLERNYGRYKGAEGGAEESIRVTACQNPAQEVEMTVSEILRMTQERGLRYREIAVLTGNMEDYGPLLERQFALEGIPCFMDRKKGLMANPLTEYIRSALEAVRRDFIYEPVFRFLKCGLAGIRREETDLLENYVIAFGVRGHRRWEEPWEREDERAALGELEELNAIRVRAAEPLLALRRELKESENVTGYVTALVHLLLSQNIFEQMEELCRRFEEENQPLMKKEYEQAYGLVMNVFDQIVRLLGEESMSLREFQEILDSGLAEIRVGVIPACLDRLVVGDLERTRLDGVKALFVLGVNEGSVPKASDAGGLFSDYDREVLKTYQIELAPTARENGFIQKFYLYLALTRAERCLTLSYAKTDASGKALKPSTLFHELFRLFPDLQTKEYGSREDQILSVHTAFSCFSRGLRDRSAGSPVWREVSRLLLGEPAFQRRAERLVEAAYYHAYDQGISRAAAKALYGDPLSASVTRLEQQAACACAQFLAYGLELRERKEFTFAMVDLGTVFHRAIELFFRKMREREMDFSSLTEEERQSLTRECVSEVTEAYGNTVLKSTARNAYMIQRIFRITDRTVWALGEQIKASGFVPAGFEVEFRAADTEALRIKLSGHETMYLNGKIDRIDLKEEEDKIYINIIDYKSGSTVLDLTSAYYGLSIQLIFYMDAALETVKKQYPGKETLPGGVLYYHIKDPIVENKGPGEMEAEEIRREMLDQLQMDGLMYPAVNELPKKVQPVSQEQFRALEDHVMKQAAALGEAIVSGDTSPVPYKKGKKTACDYCRFHAVCGFDARIPGYHYRRLKEWKPEEIWQLILENEDTGVS